MAVSAQQRSGRPAGLAATTVAEAFQVTAQAHPDRTALRTKDDELYQLRRLLDSATGRNPGWRG